MCRNGLGWALWWTLNNNNMMNICVFGYRGMRERDEREGRSENKRWLLNYMTTNINLTCPPISLCSWWGTLRLSWCFQDHHCSRSEAGAVGIGWGSARPGPRCFCHQVVSRDHWALTPTGSGPPGWWAPLNWAAAQTFQFSSTETKKENVLLISLSHEQNKLLSHHLYVGLWSYLRDLLVTSLPDTRDVAARPQEIQGWWWVKSEKCYADIKQKLSS